MQPFSPAPNSAEAWQTLVNTLGMERLIALFAGSIVLSILAYWIASLCVASERATLGRAVLTWLGILLLGFVVAVAFGVLTPFVARASGTVGTLCLIAAFVCGLIATFLGVPMKVYQIGIGRSVGYVLLAIIVGGSMQVGWQYAIVGTTPLQQFDQAQMGQMTALFDSKPKEDEGAKAESVRVALRERQADLTRRHAALEIRRKYLPQGISSAREAYETDRGAYERDLEQLRLEASTLLAR